MKKILLSVLAVAAMVACSKEYTVVAPQNNDAIGFSTHVDKATRVATDITSANIQDFGVYASVTNTVNESARILTNETVTRNGNDWSYANTQYWVPGNIYNFVAIAPKIGAQWSYSTGNLAQNGEITFNNEAALAEQDLLFAARTNVAAGTLEKVGLTFNHLLSRVAFKFTNGFVAASNMTLEVYGVKIENAVSEATVEVAEGAVAEWAQVGNTTFERTFDKQTAEATDAAILAAGAAFATEHFYLIPIAQEYTITFVVDLYQSGVKVGTYNHTINTPINLAKGGNYSISATLNQNNTGETAFEAIEFTVDCVEEWLDSGSVALTTVEVASEAELAEAVALGQNVVLTQAVSVANGLVINPATRAADDNIVVDLNGQTLTYTGNDVLFRVHGANLTINGETANSAIVTNPTTPGNGGNGYIALVKDNGTVNFLGGSYDAQATCTIAQAYEGTVNVLAGEFKVDMNDYIDANGNASYLFNCTDANYKNGTAAVNVYGGKFHGFDPANNAAEGAATNFLAEGYGSYELSEGIWTVAAKTAAINVATEAALWDVATQGGNAVLANDIVLSGCVDVKGDVTLNLNGKTLTVPATAAGYKDVFFVTSTAKMAINGEGSLIAEDGYAMWAAGDANVVINGGNYFSNVTAVYAQKNSVVIINGGTFKVDGTNNPDGDYGQVYTLNLKDNSNAAIKVNGGKFFNFNPADNTAEGEHTNFVTPGKLVEQEGDWYIVK